MNFQLDEDQTAILASLDKLAARFGSINPEQVAQRSIFVPEMQSALLDDGFLDVGFDNAHPVTAGLVVAELAKLPVAIETSASALVRPFICPDARPPIAIIHGKPDRPTRFLAQAKTALLIEGDTVRQLSITPDDVASVSTLFGYPMGCLKSEALARAVPLPAADAARLRTLYQAGIALEIYGSLDAAHRLTLGHVRDRHQFGRPIGSFQAVQHRLAIDAAIIQSCRWLGLKAAYTLDPADAATACGFAQEGTKTVCYDLHQFSGAMGLSLEYPLHLFTYRAQFLQSELGGASDQMADTADALWPRQIRAEGATLAQG